MRLRADLSQTQIASAIGISQSAIAKYENGSQIPSYEIGVKIFRLLEDNIAIHEPTLSDLMISNILFLDPKETLGEAMQKMKEYSISQIPVQNRKGVIVGTINESKILDLLDQYHSLNEFKQEEIEKIMDHPLPIIPGTCKITEVSSLLKRFGGILISDFGRIVGIITKSDLLNI